MSEKPKPTMTNWEALGWLLFILSSIAFGLLAGL